MSSLQKQLLSAIGEAKTAMPKLNYTDVKTALHSYRDYFKSLAAGEEPAAFDLRPRADALIDSFEAILVDYENSVASSPTSADYFLAFKKVLREVNRYNTDRKAFLPKLQESLAAKDAAKQAAPAATPKPTQPSAKGNKADKTEPPKEPKKLRISRSVFPVKRKLVPPPPTLKKVVPQAKEVYQLHISIVGSDPEIWRRVLVPSDMELATVHKLIQRIMDWNGEALHRFKIGYDYFGPPSPDGMDQRELYDGKTLKSVFAEGYNKLTYTYDFAAGWDHLILIEQTLPHDPAVKYPILKDGARATPPDNAGGIKRYNYLVSAIADPHNEDHELAREILGRGWEAEWFGA